VRYVLGIDAGGSKTRGLLADEHGRVIGSAHAGGANLRTHGELAVEIRLHSVAEEASGEAGVRPDAVAVGIAGADRPDDLAIIRQILARLGFRERVLVTNDARIALVAGSPARVGLALVCGTGSIAWGQNSAREVARAGGWGWYLGDEGSGFWIGVSAVRHILRGVDGRGPRSSMEPLLYEHFKISRPEQILYAVYDDDFPRHHVALFAEKVEEAARGGDEVAAAILTEAAQELALAAATVRDRLRLDDAPYDVVLSGGTFDRVASLTAAVARQLERPNARVGRLEEEPAMGAVRLAIEALQGNE
jgi:N-acetylglucosamine kinase-like BadF-type ATPase